MNFKPKKFFSVTKYLWILILIILLNSCGLLNKFAGADFDLNDFDKYREAKFNEVRLAKAEEIAKRISLNKNESDFTLSLSKGALDKVCQQYISSVGFIDASTSYVINDVKLTLNYGSAILSCNITADNSSYNVKVDLVMDCILAFEFKEGDLLISLEPFNISPTAKTGTLLSGTKDLIERLIKKNLATMSTNYPPMKFPLNIKNNYTLEEINMKVRNKLNVDINSKKRVIDYDLKLNDILILNDKVEVRVNLEKIEVAK